LTLSAALVVIGVGGAEFFLRLTNCPEELLGQATLYFRMYFAGTPLLMLYNFCAAIMRANGDSRRPMIYLTTGGAIKVALCFLFVGYFRMGVMGVALSTIISWSTSLILALWTLLHSKSAVKICIKNIGFYKEETKQILQVGIPAGLQQVLYSIANVVISATVNSFGPAATTGMSIANNYDGLTYLFCTAASYAVMPYVSQNVGAGNIKRAVSSVGKCDDFVLSREDHVVVAHDRAAADCGDTDLLDRSLHPSAGAVIDILILISQSCIGSVGKSQGCAAGSIDLLIMMLLYDLNVESRGCKLRSCLCDQSFDQIYTY
jgi:O-antigen/teichoic acid export membrane protein